MRWSGVSRILFCSGYLAGHIEQHFGTGERLNFNIQYSVEAVPAGTGGALLGAWNRLNPVFFALNGDTFFEADLPKLSALLGGAQDRLGALALREVEM